MDRKRYRNKKLIIFQRDGFACCYCGKGVEYGIRLTLDHIIPSVYGGTNDSTNLVTACIQCNNWKGDVFWKTFVQKVVENIRPDVSVDHLIGYIETQRKTGVYIPDGANKIKKKRFNG